MGDLGHGNLANFFSTGSTFFQANGLFDHVADGRFFEDKGVGAIVVDGDDSRNERAFEFFGFFIEIITEIHDFDTVGTKSGADWGSGISRSGLNSEFNDDFDFAGHLEFFGNL